ncbi:MAG: Ger(x)C family spore germination C-terminal domain-containing protein [Acutalibacteraceae bacterium]
MKKVICFLLCLAVLINFTSCTGSKQLDQRLIIQGIGIDRHDDGYFITVMYIDTEAQSEQSTKTLTANGITVADAFANTILKTGKEPLYSQNQFILLGKNTAQAGYEQALDFFTQYYEARPNVNVFVAEESANALMTASSASPKSISNISQSTVKSGRTICSTLLQLENDRLNGYSSPKTTQLTIDGEQLKADGTAVFISDKYAYSLSEEESLAALLISGKADTAGELIIEDSNDSDFVLSKCKSSINSYVENNRVYFTVEINAQADVYEQYPDKARLKSLIEKRIIRMCTQAVKKCIVQYKSDVFGFNRALLRQNTDFFKNAENVIDALYRAEYKISPKISVS